MFNKLHLRYFLAISIGFLISLNALGQEKTKLALRGFDPVSYFQEGPIKGSKKIQYTHLQLNYRFSSEENLELFETNPTSYLPDYDGYCAYGIATNGKLYKVNPKAYIITDGKIVFFYQNLFYDSKKRWEKEQAKLKEQADDNWIQLKHK